MPREGKDFQNCVQTLAYAGLVRKRPQAAPPTQ